jgi:IclR family KDG regulon transcriptional repressor
MQARAGMRTQVHASAVAKAVLAWTPKAELDEILDTWPMARLTPNTITSKRDLVQHLAQVRSRGYSVDLEEMEVGLRCVGAPIRDHTGKVAAGVSISGPRHRMTEEAIAALGPEVRHTADQISRRLGAPHVDAIVPDGHEPPVAGHPSSAVAEGA